ncbi:MAG: hypothetical protein MJK12_12375 [Colwellia sp.]|nr:hypothetical protein [Colwellia sp.]
MSDFIKTILAIIITGVLSSVVTTERLSVEIVNIKSSVEKVETKLDKFDVRLRKTEVQQAKQETYLAAN